MEMAEHSAPERVPGMSLELMKGRSPGPEPVLAPTDPAVAPKAVPGAVPVSPDAPADALTDPAAADVRMAPPAPPPPGPKESPVPKVEFVPAAPLAVRDRPE